MPVLVFAPSARDDLLAAYNFIASDKPLAATKWINAIEEKCRLLAAMPTLGENRPELGVEIRSSVFGHYVIFFRQIPNGAEIVRVIAGERDIRSL
ncbi:type II toxin-antitoxin system RelE/ParE family toxin [Blastopirellula retiformator]|uniref:type II toxin-antitoxin system RelE/ParE family toxin n=1 Tax=Blastopirellula retiformator TaxID=2527970 RepID=UPI001FE52B79|nr:type II toxin-antitoxin system RelE/ParE family toxin [Blastopirellula retiformator]